MQNAWKIILQIMHLLKNSRPLETSYFHMFLKITDAIHIFYWISFNWPKEAETVLFQIYYLFTTEEISFPKNKVSSNTFITNKFKKAIAKLERYRTIAKLLCSLGNYSHRDPR